MRIISSDDKVTSLLKESALDQVDFECLADATEALEKMNKNPKENFALLESSTGYVVKRIMRG